MSEELKERVENAEKLGYKDKTLIRLTVVLFCACVIVAVLGIAFDHDDLWFRIKCFFMLVAIPSLIVIFFYEKKKPNCFIRKDDVFLYVWRWWKWSEIPLRNVVAYKIRSNNSSFIASLHDAGYLEISTNEKCFATGLMKDVTQVLLKIKDDGNK